MLISLLSLYITSVINPHLETTINVSLKPANSIIRTASFDFSNLSKIKAIPIKKPSYISPIIHAKASISMDLSTGAILYEKNIHDRLPIASITKLMTALIILEDNDLDEIATISYNAASTGGSTMFLRQNEQITLENLLYGAIIDSANDAAIALAEHNAETIEAFTEKMNNKALQLGLVNTHFSNPIGLDNKDNYSSAYDLAKLSKYIYQKRFIRNSAQIKELTVTSVDGKLTHKLESTNDLLDSFLNIKGLKTGKTDRAGLCLVAVAENNNGNEIITVVLNSPARFTETKILVDWTFRAYNW